MQTYGTLYLLPVGLGECNIEDVLPKRNLDLIKTLTYFIAENAKEGRAFLKQCAYPEISRAQLSLINQHVKTDELNSFLSPLLQGNNMGLMSDAGCPGIADPGAEIIYLITYSRHTPGCAFSFCEVNKHLSARPAHLIFAHA